MLKRLGFLLCPGTQAFKKMIYALRQFTHLLAICSKVLREIAIDYGASRLREQMRSAACPSPLLALAHAAYGVSTLAPCR